MKRKIIKRLALSGVAAVGALLLMYGSTPPHLAEMQALSREEQQPAEPKIVQQGKASFYADSFDGKATASGEPMNQQALTAASKVLPLGTRATVTNLATGESVKVDINDRGPYVPGRVIDLSKRAADAIRMRDDGVAPVKIEAKPEDQPTPELKQKVTKIAAARERAAKRRAAQHARHPSVTHTPQAATHHVPNPASAPEQVAAQK